MPDQKPKEIDASRLTLRDHDGKARAVLEIDKDGAPYLSFYDPDDKPRIQIGIGKEGGPEVAILHKEDTGAIVLSVTPHGVSQLFMQEVGGYMAHLRVAHLPHPEATLVLGPLADPNSSVSLTSQPKRLAIKFQDKLGRGT